MEQINSMIDENKGKHTFDYNQLTLNVLILLVKHKLLQKQNESFNPFSPICIRCVTYSKNVS